MTSGILLRTTRLPVRQQTMDDDVHTHAEDERGKPSGTEREHERLDLRGKSVAEIASILTGRSIAREDGVDDPPSHAASAAPPSPSIVPEPSGFAHASRIANAPPMAPGIAGPNFDLQPLESRRLEGEAAVEDLAHRSLHAPGAPHLPIQTGQRLVAARSGRWSLVLISAAIVAIGVTLMTFLDEVRRRSSDISARVTSLLEDPSRARTPTKLPRLTVKGQKGFVNEPLPLGVSLNDASGGEKVILAGLAPGAILSVGTPLGLTSWQMLAGDVGTALVYPPKDFVGVMAAAIDLRSPGDWLIDSQIVRLEWMQREEERRSIRPLRQNGVP
jgi:hypothetical protein